MHLKYTFSYILISCNRLGTGYLSVALALSAFSSSCGCCLRAASTAYTWCTWTRVARRDSFIQITATLDSQFRLWCMYVCTSMYVCLYVCMPIPGDLNWFNSLCVPLFDFFFVFCFILVFVSVIAMPKFCHHFWFMCAIWRYFGCQLRQLRLMRRMLNFEQ